MENTWKYHFLMDDFCYGIPISGNLHVASTLDKLITLVES